MERGVTDCGHAWSSDDGSPARPRPGRAGGAVTGTAQPRTAPGTSAWRLSAGRSFTAIAAVYVLFMTASSAPSPLYVVYQREWGFSAATLTVVFAVYVLGLLGALLVLGGLSDHVGRRPVLAASIALEAASLVLFIAARSVPLLLAARLVQGIATGIALTALGATLVDLNPPRAPGRAGTVNSVAPAAGLALGALGCGALVQFAPAPTRLVWALLLGGMGLAAVVVAVIPEAAVRHPGALASLAPRSGPSSTRSCRSCWPAGHSAGSTWPWARRSRPACSA
jgi:MFS family permease